MLDVLNDSGKQDLMEQALDEFDMGAMLRQNNAQLGTSQAGLLADVINMMRVDVKMFGVLHGVDIEVEEMTEERAASLLEALVRGDPELLEVTNEIAHKRQTVILEALDDEGMREYYLGEKASMMNSADPVTWDE
jgi:hypothetical protein